ncbi:MAG: sodium:solute symporter [Phycisphaerales bacterium]|nr:sodium:solute symporter [Phycisphaerales bacterium]
MLAAYFALLIATGIWFALRARRTDTASYFKGGGHMPIWAIAISFLATAQSAATVLGVPEDAYNGDLRYLSTNIGGILAAIILARYFIPAYYRLGVSTPYQLLEHRFGPGAKLAASAVYMIGRVFASGARVFIGSIPVAMAIWPDPQPHHIAAAILIFMAFGALFTLAGGLSSVIWTDVIQVAVYLGAAILTIVILWRGIHADAPAILEAVKHGAPDGGSKLRFLSLGWEGPQGFSFKEPYTLITACTGWMLLLLAAYGTDQDLVQRLLACENARKGSWSIISGVLMGIPVVLVFAAIGILLWVYYQCPQLTGRAAPEYLRGDTGEVFLKFTLHEMPAGMVGLVLAGVMAAGPAGINSSLNSMASTFVSDIYRPLRPGRADAHYVSAGRWATAGWAVVLGAFALVCIHWKQANNEAILPFVLGVMAFAYAGMLGVFIAALFTRRGNTISAIAALLAGFIAVTLLQPGILPKWWPGSWAGDPFVLAAPWRLLAGAALATLIAIIPRSARATPLPTSSPAAAS